MSEKKGNVGPDGLTKKERRALKVQEKQSQETETQTVNTESKPVTAKQNVSPAAVNAPKLENSIKNKVDNKNTVTIGQLSEKELRKIEWQKKLADQNKADEKGQLSKAELKAKRREQQENQRAVKQTVPKSKNEPVPDKAVANKENIKEKEIKTQKTPPKKDIIKKSSHSNKLQLVQHLYLKSGSKSIRDGILVNFPNVHPAFIRLGTQYEKKTILGSNARLLALLAALKELVDDIQTPPKQEFCRYLENVLQTCTNHLQKCRPMAVSMTNALRQFKLEITQTDVKLTDNEKKALLYDFIMRYIKDDIYKAGESISMRVNEKICNGDVILTYGCSSLVKRILLDAHKNGKKFNVVVVDGRPLLEGREMLRRLTEAGVTCTYILVNSLSFVMNSVTKVLLGAHALLTNGYVMSRIGTAQVAMVAKDFNKPVLVCCETYKFSERVQTDSFVYNEIGDENILKKIDTVEENTVLSSLKENSSLSSLVLLYDVTPADMVTAVVTEIAILPCTSVPVVLRIHAH